MQREITRERGEGEDGAYGEAIGRTIPNKKKKSKNWNSKERKTLRI